MIPLDMLMMQLKKELEFLFSAKRVRKKMENELYDGDSTIGHTLYKEITKVEFMKMKGKWRLAQPTQNYQWETLATYLEEFQQISIENENGPSSKVLGVPSYLYMTWAAKMAVELEFWGKIKQRSGQDLSYAVARFIQKGGSFVNYYMYHGGTHYGRIARGPFITTTYDYDAPLDEYGLIKQPKYGHLTELHRAIKLCEKALISTDPVVISLGSYQQAHVFSLKGGCAAFLANHNPESVAKVVYNNKH
ncbi:hypothetical protein GIB67_032274 [Kingdonia uniflora]|uniref:beta-galactosidase n=1 Tax=Kingdonia uniflora TaxID=39325 RepID=A0A7J7MX97_9MAGN|nr:hypothetical protein GIB67_032274 [Kingdonia uniflora]